jgi:starvation-inducible DNA-binding protein
MNYRRNPDNNEAIVDGLQALLADTYILYIKTQNFHWNVKGPSFGPLHTLFGAQYAELALAVDLIAERITAMDGYAAGSCREFISESSLTEIGFTDSAPIEEIRKKDSGMMANQMIKWLLVDHQKISEECRSFLEKLDDYDDDVTAQLVADRALAHDKMAWMLKSHLE